ncbi:MAG: M14 family metallopeptidase [Gemmatimonadetes bacterium]|nr:M14 family metallopeptidase [Gemmatimonadota bacterium]MDA1102404.1 M14 family metallopeptidase [Gemmatimonadota bacterium]
MYRSYLSVSALAISVFTAPLAGQIPTPESVLGFVPGADFHLATYEESIDYFQRLDAASDRLTMVRVGRTSEGRDWWIGLISTPDNLRDAERYRRIADQIAHPAELTDALARELAREGKAIVDISGGLHASEAAGAQHTIGLAYELVASEEPRIAAIRENVITVLWPSLNPDGQTMIADWYTSNVDTPFEVAPMPWLYQKYVGHDNNRDAYMMNMVESRVVARTWQEWDPQIIHVHHQSSPFPTRIWLPPFAEPIATFAPPLMSRTVNSIGMTIATMLESRGLPGATHMGTGFDAWYPGYVDYMPVLQNQAAFWTETALYRYATPHFYTLQDFPAGSRDLRAESLYPSPWKGGWWRLGDAVEYMHVASIAVLDYAAKYREDLLYNRYQSGRDQIRKYEASPPYAYFVPQDQRDPVAPVELLRRLAYNGLAVYQLSAPVSHEGLTHPAGTWVVPTNQAFGELARQVMGVQSYPDLREYPEGPPEQPYDAAGWTLPYQMDVRVIEASQPLGADVRAVMQALTTDGTPWDAEGVDPSPFDRVGGVGFDSHPVAAAVRPPEGRTTGSGAALLLDPAQNNSFRALNAAWDAGANVRFGNGTYSVTGLSGAARDGMVSDFALRATLGSPQGAALPRARLGLYRPWSPSMDEGWTRWLFDEYAFAYTNVRDADMHAGDLRERYDVIVLPSERAGSLMEGFARGSVPPQYEGGLGAEGVRNLDAFVRAGGTLVCMSAASDLCIDELHLPVQNVVSGLGRGDFFSAGSILEVKVDTRHPLMAGMPERAKIFFDRSPVFTTSDDFKGSVLAAYATDGSPLLSGYLLGEDHISGQAAALDVAHGQGHVVLLGFRPQWRGQPSGTFRTLFNSLLYHGEVATTATGTPDFWTKPATKDTLSTS